MRYVSPFTLFGEEDAQVELSEKSLFLQKRKLLSEFELFNSSTIEVSGRELTKNDVLNMFNAFENEPHLNFHLIVAKDKVLLYFLEHHQIEFKQKFSLQSQDLTPAFIEWLSPHFKKAFAQCAMAAVESRDSLSFNTLIKNPRFMTQGDEIRAWQPVQKFFDNLIFQLSEINNSRNHFQQEWDIKDYASKDMQDIVKNLPVEKFQSQINAYAYELMRASLSIFSFDKGWSMNLIADTLGLPVTQDIRNTLEEKRNEIENAYSGRNSSSSSSSSDDSSLWAILRVLCIVVFAIARLATCNSSSSSSNSDYSYTPPSYNQGTSQDLINDIMEKARKKRANALNDGIISFLTAIEENSVKFESKQDAMLKSLQNGDDPYSDVWKSLKESNASFPDKESFSNGKQAVYNNNHTDTAGLSKFLRSPYAFVTVKNKSNYNCIIIINRGDSLFSSYIKAGTTLKLPLLKDCEANTFIYAGKKFTFVPGATAKISMFGNDKDILLPGGFTDLSGQNSAFMRQSIRMKNISSCTIANEDETKIAVKLSNNK